ncbi:hypothetical protein An01g07310 [Aspergillus niger]|uniref:Uncharacterized protein n=2 Tax=Aspergillus niger TaxID=5061 RepID=A2Q9B6_ASPNC|nr:hypothetical protein An01g07310 [Aspergillus niger]CAK43850.1 hypothetical protein An01g07310 [Aspergillus niger]
MNVAGWLVRPIRHDVTGSAATGDSEPIVSRAKLNSSSSLIRLANKNLQPADVRSRGLHGNPACLVGPNLARRQVKSRSSPHGWMAAAQSGAVLLPARHAVLPGYSTLYMQQHGNMFPAAPIKVTGPRLSAYFYQLTSVSVHCVPDDCLAQTVIKHKKQSACAQRCNDTGQMMRLPLLTDRSWMNVQSKPVAHRQAVGMPPNQMKLSATWPLCDIAFHRPIHQVHYALSS